MTAGTAGTTQVLVVDDSDTIRDLVQEMLVPAGYAVQQAEDGVQGLSKLRASASPAVVLLDFEMPNMRGDELLETVKREGGALEAHEFVIITANQHTFPAQFIELLRRLSIRVLPKPFSKDQLLTLVEGAEARLTAVRDALPVLPEN